MIINVTEEDIANGKRCDAQHCPIATAVIRDVTAALIRDRVPGDTIEIDTVCVTHVDIWIEYKRNGRMIPRTYTGARGYNQFIHDFDHERPIKPFQLEINPTSHKTFFPPLGE